MTAKCFASDGVTEVHTLQGVGLVVSAVEFNRVVAECERLKRDAERVKAAVMGRLDGLKDDAIAHIWLDDLVRCQTSECVVPVVSVRMGSPDGMTVPLFSRDQVAEAIDAALTSKETQ